MLVVDLLDANVGDGGTQKGEDRCREMARPSGTRGCKERFPLLGEVDTD